MKEQEQCAKEVIKILKQHGKCTIFGQFQVGKTMAMLYTSLFAKGYEV